MPYVPFVTIDECSKRGIARITSSRRIIGSPPMNSIERMPCRSRKVSSCESIVASSILSFGRFGLSARNTKQCVHERLHTFVTFTSALRYSRSPKSVGSRIASVGMKLLTVALRDQWVLSAPYHGSRPPRASEPAHAPGYP